jgi:hypothetical protein
MIADPDKSLDYFEQVAEDGDSKESGKNLFHITTKKVRIHGAYKAEPHKLGTS